MSRIKRYKHTIETNFNDYEINDTFQEARHYKEARTIYDLYRFAKEKQIEVEAKTIFTNGKHWFLETLDTENFVRVFEGEKKQTANLRESLDLFSQDDYLSLTGDRIGEDFIPLLGGAFNKQLYYRDYLRMHALCFYAWNHDPVAKRAVEMIHQFALGKGFKIESGDKRIQDCYELFCEEFDFEKLVDFISIESIIYGEIFVWFLPENKKYISFDNPVPGHVAKSLFPTIKLIDPSVIWEVVTLPEDIERVLGYWWVAPTQYQIKTSINSQQVPGMRFIAQEIPANQVLHFKKNCVSNEKRGRSDLFPVLGYLKRLRDSVNYQIAADQKVAAWAIDTEVTGSQEDINNYIESMQEINNVPAGSEFVHSDKIKRRYLSNERGSGSSNSFEWTLSMIAMGLGIPISYFGSHLSGGQTRASAVVSTEPSIKLFEEHQKFVGKIIKKILKRVFASFGLYEDFNVIFPELITQDRSQKLRDLAAAQAAGWISARRAAEIASKELGIDDFDYSKELEEIKNEPSLNTQDLELEPLTTPSKLSSDEKREIKQDGTR